MFAACYCEVYGIDNFLFLPWKDRSSFYCHRGKYSGELLYQSKKLACELLASEHKNVVLKGRQNYIF